MIKDRGRSVVLFVVYLLFSGLFHLYTPAQTFAMNKPVYITPFVGKVFLADSFNPTDHTGPLLGLGAGIDLTTKWGMEVSYIAGKTSHSDRYFSTYRLHTLYNFLSYPNNRFIPFITLGAGGTDLHPTFSDLENNFIADYGAGLKYFLSEKYIARGEVKHSMVFDHKRIDNMEVFLGLSYVMGYAKKENVVAVVSDQDKDGVPDLADHCPTTSIGVVVDGMGCPSDRDKDGVPDNLDACLNTPTGVSVDAKGCPVVKPLKDADSDGDGVLDGSDKCPNTPGGLNVDKDGCPQDKDKDGVTDQSDRCPGTPAGVFVDGNGCPLDSDKDGISDDLDRCPNTSAGVAVDANGCPLPVAPPAPVVPEKDSDSDGVFDSLDQCPDTPKGMPVDAKGCPVVKEKVSVELNIVFDMGKAEIKALYDEDIRRVGEFLKNYPDTKVEIEGHTDNVGSEKRNESLSQQRAEAVKQRLVKTYGIDASRVTAIGYGSSKPIADNGTADGRNKNRRVMATITATK